MGAVGALVGPLLVCVSVQLYMAYSHSQARNRQVSNDMQEDASRISPRVLMIWDFPFSLLSLSRALSLCFVCWLVDGFFAALPQRNAMVNFGATSRVRSFHSTSVSQPLGSSGPLGDGFMSSPFLKDGEGIVAEGEDEDEDEEGSLLSGVGLHDDVGFGSLCGGSGFLDSEDASSVVIIGEDGDPDGSEMAVGGGSEGQSGLFSIEGDSEERSSPLSLDEPLTLSSRQPKLSAHASGGGFRQRAPSQESLSSSDDS